MAGAALTAAMIAGWAGPGAAETITLDMVGAWAPKVSADADIAIHFMEEVNAKGEGKVEIVFKGSAEVVPVFDQPEALVRGVFDVWYGAPNYWAGVVPAGYVTELAKTDIPDQGPDSELFQMMVDMYEPAGVRYLGHFAGDAETGSHYLMIQDEISSIEDLKGVQVRTPPLTRFFVEAVGAEPVTLPPGEIYIALERGTVDGFTWPYFDGFTNFGWHEVSKYIVDQPLYRNGIGINMNLESWESLPDDVKAILMEAVESTQQWALDWVAQNQEKELKTMLDAGMEQIELSEEEGQRWTETAQNALWEHFKSVMSEEDYAKARESMGF